MKNRVAIVCILNNEYNLLPSWICWHKQLGFDNFILFDDSSTDGSREFLEYAKDMYNIELYDTKSFDKHNYMIRQEEAYKWTIKTYAGRFDWLLFIDIDEFISFYNKLSVGQFLSRFENAHAIGVNWCQYGSNGHILDPALPTVEAYIRHDAAGNLFSAHVKSFVRPEKIGENWINVHCFDVAPEFYYDASGNKLEWSSTSGISNRSADWSVAKIMHYQVRSMQTFIERVKKRKDLSYSPQTFYDLDTNHIEDLSPYELSGAVRNKMKELIIGFNQYIQDILCMSIHKYILWTLNLNNKSLISLKSYHGTIIVWNKSNQRLFHLRNTDLSDPNLDYVFSIIDASREFIFILAVDTCKDGSPDKSVIRLIDFAKIDASHQFGHTMYAISNIIDKKFYSAEINTGIITADKENKKEWELFYCDNMDNIQVGQQSFGSAISSYITNYSRVCNDINNQNNTISVDIFAILERLAFLDRDDCMFLLRSLAISKEYSNLIFNNIINKRNFGLDL